MKRRQFLVTTATATAATAFGFQVVPSRVLRAAPGENTPNNKLRIAAIGCGGQGGADLNAMQSEDIVALCDVDDRRAAAASNKWPNAKRFKDFRRMFDAMSDQIDAVLVATPDHTHAPAVLNAIGRGKAVYCEKPLAHSVAEVRLMRKAALDKKVITQVGNQGHASDHIRFFCELIWAGAIGQVREIHAGCDAFKEVYCQIDKKKAIETETHPVPKELDWNLWLGPAAERPYHPAYVPFNWRGFSAFGSGCIGDWICHVLDPSYWALDLGMPSAITAETTGYDPQQHAEFYPKGTRITYEFPAKGDRGPVKFIWHDGDFRIPRPPQLEEGRNSVGTGAVVFGEKGAIMHGSHGAGDCRIIPEADMKAFPRPDEKIPRIRGQHHKEFLDAVRSNKPAGSPFEYGGAMSEIGLLGMIAIRYPGVRLEWDDSNMKFANHPEASQLIDPPHRTGWL